MFLGYLFCIQDDVCQDQGMLQEVKKMFTDMKSGLLTLQKQVTESMHSQTAHFQKRELYQQDKIQLQEQVSKLIDKNLASQVSNNINILHATSCESNNMHQHIKLWVYPFM